MASTAIRERRRALRYRNLLVRQTVQMKNKIAMLLMEAGVSYNKQRLHQAGYFRELLATNPHLHEGLGSLLRLCCETVVRLQRTESALVRSLERDALLTDRVQRLMTIPAVGRSGVDLGSGGRGRAAFFLDQESHQLLRAVWGGKKFGEHRATHAAIQTAQQTFTDHADRGGEDGAALQPGLSNAL